MKTTKALLPLLITATAVAAIYFLYIKPKQDKLKSATVLTQLPPGQELVMVSNKNPFLVAKKKPTYANG